MATLTALKPRPYIFPRKIAQIELVQALPEDLKVYSHFLEKEVLRHPLIFWLSSSVSGRIESTPRILTEEYDAKKIKTWLDCKMMWIAKETFN